MLTAPRNHVDDQAAARLRREDVRAPAQVLLDDVVLRGAAQVVRADAVIAGVSDVETEEPRRGGVDRHRRVHPLDRDLVEQRAHVALVHDGDANLADFTTRERVVRVVARLCRKVERDG